MALITRYISIFLTAILTGAVIFSLFYNQMLYSTDTIKIVKRNYEYSNVTNLANLENKFCYDSLFTSQSIYGGLTLDDLVTFDRKHCTSVHNLFTLLKNGCIYEQNFIDSNIRISDEDFYSFEKDLVIGSSDNSDNSKELVSVMNDEEEDDEDIIVEDEYDEDDDEEEDDDDDDDFDDEEDEDDDEDLDDDLVSFNEHDFKDTRKKTAVLYIVICLLLFMSMGLSLAEFWREKRLKNKVDEQQIGNAEKYTGSRRISIADLTVNKHARKETQLKDSMTNCKSGRIQLARRSSFPAQIPDFIQTRARFLTHRQQSWSPSHRGGMYSRKTSIDYTDDDLYLDHRRVRLIRRH